MVLSSRHRIESSTEESCCIYDIERKYLVKSFYLTRFRFEIFYCKIEFKNHVFRKEALRKGLFSTPTNLALERFGCSTITGGKRDSNLADENRVLN